MKFIFLGIVQGITEFLPISSSGHLFFIQKLLKVEGDYLSFFVFLHLATLLAIIVFFSKKIKLFFKARFLLNILLITLISGIMGLGIRFYLKELLGSTFMLTFCFLANAGILFSIRPSSGERDISSINFKDVLFLGLLQGFSPLPGISRSGITIVGLLRRGFKRSEAFILSFLMAIPLIIGAFFVEVSAGGGSAFGGKDLGRASLSWQNMSLGFMAAFVFGLLALSLVRKTLISKKFKNFAYYSLLLALLTLIL